MDPSPDLPATTEPATHTAHAANPTPSHGPNHNHPSYAEMITAAVVALKDKKGSSRTAIAKYIDKEYSNLPPTHSALLTHHLKRLKNSGQLVMVKHSYKLPRSVPLPSPHQGTTVNASPLSSGPKRGPGRPPKPKPIPDAQPSGGVGTGAEALLESLGLIDAPLLPPPPTPTEAKRSRGRPPKVKVGVEAGGAMVVKRGRGRGRPPRPRSLAAVMGQGGPKRGRNWPSKARPTSVPGLGSVSRPRGRPKRDASSKVMQLGRPRGRPPKNVQTLAAIDAAGALVPIVSGVVKGRGRPPKLGAPKKPRKLTGRPLGRPKKNGSGTSSQSLGLYEDLKSKLEYFQSRIKIVVSVVKPYLSTETTVGALGALQELEELATMDVNAPLNVQSQEPLLQN